MKEKPKVLKSEIVATTKVFCIESLELEFSNGRIVQFERLASRGNSAVLVVPMLNEHTILLVREYAAGVDRYELGLVKGSVEQGEPVLAAANRELMEEVGYSAGNLQVIKRLSTSPSYNQHIMHVVLATDLVENARQGDEPEPLDVIPWPVDRINELVARPDFTDPRCLTAIFMMRDKLHGPESDMIK